MFGVDMFRFFVIITFCFGIVFSHLNFILALPFVHLSFHLLLVILFCSAFIKCYLAFSLISRGVSILSKINLLVLFVLVLRGPILLHVFWLIYLLVVMII